MTIRLGNMEVTGDLALYQWSDGKESLIGSPLKENKRRGSWVSMDIPQSQAPTMGTNWFTDVTQVGTEATFLFTVVTELRTEGLLVSRPRGFSESSRTREESDMGTAPCLEWQRGPWQRQGTYVAILWKCPSNS